MGISPARLTGPTTRQSLAGRVPNQPSNDDSDGLTGHRFQPNYYARAIKKEKRAKKRRQPAKTKTQSFSGHFSFRSTSLSLKILNEIGEET